MKCQHTLDYVDRLELQDEDLERYFNEIRSLNYLSQGLSFLDAQVQKIEATVIEKLPKNLQVSVFGNHPDLAEVPQDLIACAFHWYSVTACNYVKLIGWMADERDSYQASEYVRQVLPEVHVWRNKIGAHFARINPRKEDTPADLAQSVMFPISFFDDAFYSNQLKLTIRSKNQTTSSRNDMTWSLTGVHRQLTLRYWPNQAN